MGFLKNIQLDAHRPGSGVELSLCRFTAYPITRGFAGTHDLPAIVRRLALALGLAKCPFPGHRWGRFWKQRAQYQLLDYMLGTAFGSYESRLEIWGRATYILQDFSFTGIGMGLFGNLVDLIYPLFLVGSGKVVHAHNLFLQIGVDLGLPGLIAWFSIYGAVLAITLNITRVGKQTDDHWLAGLGYGLLGSQLVLGLHGLLDSVTWGVVRSAPLVWALWAIVWVVHHNYCRPADSFPNEAVA